MINGDEIPTGGLGEVIRRVLSFNMKGFSYLMEYFATLPATRENLLVFQISKMGFHQNYYLYKQLEDFEFYAGDEPSGDYAEAMSLDFARLEGKVVEEASKDVENLDGRARDLEELEKLASLNDTRIMENNGNTNDTVEAGDVGDQKAFDDWYARLYGDKAKG